MKKIGLILFASLAMSVGAMAQMPNFDRGEMLKNMTDNQAERLKLNKEQAAKMLVLNDSLMSIPLLCLEGVPDLSSTPKDEAGLTRKFET